MKYMVSGSFQSHPLMRLTLGLTLVFLIGFVVTNFTLYFSKMTLDPASVVLYYNGSEETFHPARSFQSMLEVTHGHLPMMAMVLLVLTHLVIFVPVEKWIKVSFICTAFGSALLNEGAGWLVRFVDPSYAILKVTGFMLLQSSLIILLIALGIFLLRTPRPPMPRPATENGDSDEELGESGRGIQLERRRTRRVGRVKPELHYTPALNHDGKS